MSHRDQFRSLESRRVDREKKSRKARPSRREADVRRTGRRPERRAEFAEGRCAGEKAVRDWLCESRARSVRRREGTGDWTRKAQYEHQCKGAQVTWMDERGSGQVALAGASTRGQLQKRSLRLVAPALATRRGGGIVERRAIERERGPAVTGAGEGSCKQCKLRASAL